MGWASRLPKAVKRESAESCVSQLAAAITTEEQLQAALVNVPEPQRQVAEAFLRTYAQIPAH